MTPLDFRHAAWIRLESNAARRHLRSRGQRLPYEVLTGPEKLEVVYESWMRTLDIHVDGLDIFARVVHLSAYNQGTAYEGHVTATYSPTMPGLSRQVSAADRLTGFTWQGDLDTIAQAVSATVLYLMGNAGEIVRLFAGQPSARRVLVRTANAGGQITLDKPWHTMAS